MPFRTEAEPHNAFSNTVLIVDSENRGGYAEQVANLATQAGLKPLVFDRADNAYGHLHEAGLVIASLQEPKLRPHAKANSPWNLLKKADELGLALAVIKGSGRDWMASVNQRDIIVPNDERTIEKAFTTWFPTYFKVWLGSDNLDRVVGLTD